MWFNPVVGLATKSNFGPNMHFSIMWSSPTKQQVACCISLISSSLLNGPFRTSKTLSSLSITSSGTQSVSVSTQRGLSAGILTLPFQNHILRYKVLLLFQSAPPPRQAHHQASPILGQHQFADALLIFLADLCVEHVVQ